MKGLRTEIPHMMVPLLSYSQRGTQVVFEALGLASGRRTYEHMPPAVGEGRCLHVVVGQELLNFNKSKENWKGVKHYFRCIRARWAISPSNDWSELRHLNLLSAERLGQLILSGFLRFWLNWANTILISKLRLCVPAHPWTRTWYFLLCIFCSLFNLCPDLFSGLSSRKILFYFRCQITDPQSTVQARPSS